jgi:hypothetical protein
MFDEQDDCRAFSRALAKTGKRMAARMAMIAITTNSSISVKALRDDFVLTGYLHRSGSKSPFPSHRVKSASFSQEVDNTSRSGRSLAGPPESCGPVADGGMSRGVEPA